MKISKQKIKVIHTLLHSYGNLRGFGVDKEEKMEFVRECSGGRCTSTKDLTMQEADEMILTLQNLTYSTKNYRKADRQRKKILHYAHQMNWELDSGKVNMKMVDRWCEKYGYLHKPLNKYNVKELPKLLHQFQQMYYSYLKGVSAGR